MQPPFTVERFYGVFRDNNTAVWPTQCFLAAMALVAVAAFRQTLASLLPAWWALALWRQRVNGIRPRDHDRAQAPVAWLILRVPKELP
jgi:hypothetical protein